MKNGHCSEKVGQYLISKFGIGEQLIWKERGSATGVARYGESEGEKREASVFPRRVVNQSLNTRVFLPFVRLDKETGRAVSEHRG